MQKLFAFIIEVIGWTRVVLSPLFGMLFVAVLLYYMFPSEIMKGVGIGLGVLGLIIGILWANHVWRKYGTIHFWSKISATPELAAESKEPEVENKKAK